MPGPAIALFAPAKLNLNLNITGRRADGYHLLESVVAFLTVGDTLEFQPSEKLELQQLGDFAAQLGAPDDNLILRAARLLQQHASVNQGASIILNKQLPVGSGMGGGSADAAATLHGLQELWNLHLSHDILEALALQLGSDIPVCLDARTAHISGVGEVIRDAGALPDVPLLLVNPKEPLLTAEVYKAFGETFSAPPSPMPHDHSTWLDWMQTQKNDLQTPAIRRLPAIREILHALEETDGCHIARMSGSGATCFGIYTDMAARDMAKEHIEHTRPNWWVMPTAFLDV